MKFQRMAVALIAISLGISNVAYAGIWKTDDKGTYYSGGKEVYSGWNNIDGKDHYINSEGYSQSGWVQDSNSWYYCNNTGAKKTGWVQDNGKWYYLSEKTGQMQTGWLKLGNNQYYLGNSGEMLTGWQNINNVWYLFNDSGEMKYNQWYNDGTNWYFLESGGNMSVGWENIDGPYYYFDTSGHMQSNGWIKVDGCRYYLRPDGSMLTGDQKLPDGKWYKFGSNGVYLDNVWYNGKWYNNQSNGNKSASVREYKLSYKDNQNRDSKPGSNIRTKVETALNKVPNQVLTAFFSRSGRITYYTEKDSIESRRLVYNTYDYDDNGDESDKDKYDTVDVTAKYSSNNIEFCMEPEGILQGFGYFIDDWMKSNDTYYKSEAVSPSQAEEFDGIYDSEYQNLKDNIEGYRYDLPEMNQSDYFSKSYQLYRQGNKSFVELCPKTNAYIQKIEQQMIFDIDSKKK